MVDSIQALTPSQLNIPTEDDDDYDEETALKKMEGISRDPMRLIYYIMLIEKVESKFVCERSEQTYFLRSKVKAFYSYQNSRAKIFYLRDCARVARAQIYSEKLV